MPNRAGAVGETMRGPDREGPVTRLEPCTVVIFGASGDLTQRKLVPALYNLHLDGLLPKSFAVVGVSRREMPRDGFVESLREGVEAHSRRQPDPQVWREFASAISCVAAGTPEGYRAPVYNVTQEVIDLLIEDTAAGL